MGRVIRVLDLAAGEFSVDAYDYRVLKKLALLNGSGMSNSVVRPQDVDEERNIVRLNIVRQVGDDFDYLSMALLPKLRHLEFRFMKYVPNIIGIFENLTTLTLRYTDITCLPPSIGNLRNLEGLDLAFTGELTGLPEEIGDLTNLKRLDLDRSSIRSLPFSIGRLQNLEKLNLFRTMNLLTLPDEIRNLTSLKDLSWKTVEIPESIAVNLNTFELDCGTLGITNPMMLEQFWNLKHFKLNIYEVPTLPDEIGDMFSLTSLVLWDAEMRSIPPTIGLLQNLEFLHIHLTRYLFSLPEEIGYLMCLKVLIINGYNIESLPYSIGYLKNLEELDLSHATSLSEIPDSIGNLTNLIKLKVMQSNVKALPPSIGQLQNLQELNLQATQKIRKLPDEIGNLSSLIKLDMCWSKIEELPSSIGRLQNLEELYLRGTKHLSKLPEEIGNLTSIIKFDISGSKVEGIPFPLSIRNKLGYMLACRYARSQLGWSATHKAIRIEPKLFPLILSNATSVVFNNDFDCAYQHISAYSIPESDCIYRLLADSIESFVGLLVATRGGISSVK